MKKQRKVRTGWKEYFNFSTREKRGALVLAVIITIQLSLLLAIRLYKPEPDPVEKQVFLDAFRKIHADTADLNLQSIGRVESAFLHPVKFDPNTANEKLLMQNGLSERQARIILNFVKKGGRFRIKSDMKKIYSIDSLTYQKLYPFIDLPEQVQTTSFISTRQVIVDIASADSAQLVAVKGIGPVLAGRIIRYRNALGGFHSIEQLREVYGVNDTLFAMLTPFIQLSDDKVKMLSINDDSLQVLVAHPYLKYKLGNAIVNYRKQHGPLGGPEDLRKLPFVNEDNLRKLAPYLKF